jgi:ABC-2 type transport system permease protein
MTPFLRLIQSESFKIYSRKSTWIMAAFLVFSIFLTSTATWVHPYQTIWGLVVGQSSALFLINIYIVIIGGGIIANEYNWGTIKLLLIRPVSRGRILYAKYVSLMLFGLLMVLLLFLIAMVVNGALLILHNNGADLIGSLLPGKRLWYDSFGGATQFYGLRFAEVAIYGTFAFMLSTISKSSTLTVGASLLMMLFGPEITQVLIDKPWGKYLLFANLDLTAYLKGDPKLLPGMSMGFSTIVLLCYGLTFYFISRAVFVKRDVLE